MEIYTIMLFVVPNIYILAVLLIPILTVAFFSIISFIRKSINPIETLLRIGFDGSLISFSLLWFLRPGIFNKVISVGFLLLYFYNAWLISYEGRHTLYMIKSSRRRDGRIRVVLIISLIVFSIIWGSILLFIYLKHIDIYSKIQKDVMPGSDKVLLFNIFIFSGGISFVLCGTSWIMSLIIKDLLRYYQEKDLGVVFENWDSKIKTLNKLIIDGELLGAIETIETFAVVNKEIQLGITCTLLKASLKELERKYSMNLIGLEQLNIEKSRISEKILNLAEQYNTSGETVKNIYNIII